MKSRAAPTIEVMINKTKDIIFAVFDEAQGVSCIQLRTAAHAHPKDMAAKIKEKYTEKIKKYRKNPTPSGVKAELLAEAFTQAHSKVRAPASKTAMPITRKI